MALTEADLKERLTDEWIPAFKREKDRLDRIDRWYRWDHDKPHAPRSATREYRELTDRAQTPWLRLVVTAVAQNLYVEGYTSVGATENSSPWGYWQANGFDARQIALHRSALKYGLTYETVLPGKTQSGDAMPVMRGVSPRQMMAFFADPADDDWPECAVRIKPVKVGSSAGWKLRVYDDASIYHLTSDSSGSGLDHVMTENHGAGVCPVVRFTFGLDDEGRTDGDVEPYISVASRIDQTTFDRLVVQRFASWVVRTISGMAKPDDKSDAEAEKLRLRVEDILVAEDADTKFGSLPATDLAGFIAAREADIRDLAAVSQTPPDQLLGQMANLSADALAAARTSNSRKTEECRHEFGEAHEKALRLGAVLMGDDAAATDYSAQVRWRDTEARSLAQVVDALGKMAEMLGIPVEMLWERIPGWTQQDVERAKTLVAELPTPPPDPTATGAAA